VQKLFMLAPKPSMGQGPGKIPAGKRLKEVQKVSSPRVLSERETRNSTTKKDHTKDKFVGWGLKIGWRDSKETGGVVPGLTIVNSNPVLRKPLEVCLCEPEEKGKKGGN